MKLETAYEVRRPLVLGELYRYYSGQLGNNVPNDVDLRTEKARLLKCYNVNNITLTDLNRYLVNTFPSFHNWLSSRFLNYFDLSEHVVYKLTQFENLTLPMLKIDSPYELELIEWYITSKVKELALAYVIRNEENCEGFTFDSDIDELNYYFYGIPSNQELLKEVLEGIDKDFEFFREALLFKGYSAEEERSVILLAYCRGYAFTMDYRITRASIPYSTGNFKATKVVEYLG